MQFKRTGIEAEVRAVVTEKSKDAILKGSGDRKTQYSSYRASRVNILNML